MMSTLKFFFCLSIMASVSAMAGHKPSSVKVIYGEDDRVEPHTVTDKKLLAVSRSVAAMIPASSIISSSTPTSSGRSTTTWGRRSEPPRTGGEVSIKAPTLTERGVCSTERFSNQITAANCSGFLVAEDVLVTAGHCIETQTDCDEYRWVFDYQVGADGNLAKLNTENVYECQKILGRELSGANGTDFAVIKLSKVVKGREPMKLNLTGKPVEGDDVIVLGHPTGLPQKIAAGATVKKLAGNHFYSNLDTYGGNSGSAVINGRTYEVEGILVRGQKDYVRSPTGTCSISNVLPDSMVEAEEVSFIGQTFATLGINSLASK